MIAFTLQPCRAISIIGLLLRQLVIASIDFYDQALWQTDEIGYKGANDVLSSEVDAQLFTSQASP